MVARCDGDMHVSACCYLAVEILALTHFGGNRLEDLRPGYEMCLYVTVLGPTLQSLLYLLFVR